MRDPGASARPVRRLPRRLGLRQNFSWTFLGDLTYTFARWGMLLVLAKLGDAATVGLFALGLAICQPILLLTSLHLRPALVTDRAHEFRYGQYIGLRLIGSVMIVVIATAVCLIAGYPPETTIVVVLISIGVAILAVREMFLGIMQKHECMNYSAFSQLLLSVGAFTAFTTAFVLTRSLVVAIASLLGVRLAVLLLYDIPRARAIVRHFLPERAEQELRPDWSLGMLRQLGLRTLPLGAAMTVGTFSNNVQHYFLKGFHGDRMVGYYGAMFAMMQAAILLSNTMGVAASPRLADCFRNNPRQFLRLLGKLVAIAAALGLVGVLVAAVAGRWLLRLLFTPEYAEYAPQFVWLAGATALMFVASMFVVAMTAARRFWVILAAWIVAGTVSVVASWAWVPQYAISGAVWARTAALGTLVVTAGLGVWYVWRTRPPAPKSAAAGHESAASEPTPVPSAEA